MSGSIETRLRDKDVPKPPRVPRISPSALPAFNSEAPSPDDTAEKVVLRASRKKHLIDIPLNVAGKIVIVDALDYHITSSEKLALIACGLWSASGKVDDIQQYLGVSGYSRINPLLNLVQENTQSARSSIKLGDCMQEVSEIENILKSVDRLAEDSDDRERLKAVVEEILKLQGDGLANEQIIKRRAAIQEAVGLRLSAEAQSKPPVI
jgi:hypothetical protein